MGRRSPTLDEWRGAVSADLQNIKDKLDESMERFERALNEHADLDTRVQSAQAIRITEVERSAALLRESASGLQGRIVAFSVIASVFIAAVANAVMRQLIG